MSKIEKKIKIRLISEMTHYLDDDDSVSDFPENEKIEYATEGRLILKDDIVTVEYDESREMGMDGVTTSLIFNQSERGKLSMVRKGVSPTSMIFDLSERRRMCSYEAGYAPLEFSIQTYQVKNNITPEDGGSIFLDYDIEVRGFRVEKNKLEISVVTL